MADATGTQYGQTGHEHPRKARRAGGAGGGEAERHRGSAAAADRPKAVEPAPARTAQPSKPDYGSLANQMSEPRAAKARKAMAPPTNQPLTSFCTGSLVSVRPRSLYTERSSSEL